MAKWMVAAKKADFNGIGKELGIDPVVVRVMRNRGMTSIEEMRAFLSKGDGIRHDPYLLPDMDKAVDIILNKISEKKSIRIIGDYDVDGVTSVTILYKGFMALGTEVSYAIPNRVYDGYGINEQMIQRAHDDGIDTIITCDNGIAAIGAIELGKSLGLTCIVTDHHEVPYTEADTDREYIYPPADAIIDPKLPGCGYPYEGICGAMVAYKLICALVKRLGREDEALLNELKELAGIATVCDVMELRDENRAVTAYTLESMRHSRNTGIRALRRVCGTEDKTPNVHELGFIIGPCLNATGRLDDADRSVELLLSEDEQDAVVTATELKQLNDLRKGYTEDGEREALRYIEDNGIENDRVMVIYLPDLHESLAGIVAGRIKERFYRPTLVFTDSGDCVKGSGRSIEAYDMYAELNKFRDMYIRFGGHKMAAGLSMDRNRLTGLRQMLNEGCTLSCDELERKITIDVPMPLGYVSEELIGELSSLEPFGTGNPKPVFADKELRVISAKEMGKSGDMCRLTVRDTMGRTYELVMFKGYTQYLTEIDKIQAAYASEAPDADDIGDVVDITIDVIYYPDINEFRGRRSIQYIVQDFRVKGTPVYMHM